MKIMTVVGARPQFIKTPLLSYELRKDHDEFIVHTGQHYDYELSKIFFKELDIPEPKYNLEAGSGTHASMTADILVKVEALMKKEKPNLVIVFGDTNSTLAAALAASKLNIKLAHVEAGMRNFDRKKPEEINRIMVDHISDFLFPPTQTASLNLEKEGCDQHQKIYHVGDVTYDLFVKSIGLANEKSHILNQLGVHPNTYNVLTIHKQKNTQNMKRLKTIFTALLSLDIPFVFPVHPRTVKALKSAGLWEKVQNSKIMPIEPLGYLDFIKLVQNSSKVVTDSGGVQKDAYVSRVPCVTLVQTSWNETVDNGWNKISAVEYDEIRDHILNFDPKHLTSPPFLGDGDAYKKIASVIKELEKEILSEPNYLL